MTSAQLESMLRELALARRSANQFKEELTAIQATPAWRLVTAYRSWRNHGPGSGIARVVDRTIRRGIERFLPSGSGQPPEAHSLDGELVYCLHPMYLGRYFYCRDGKRHWVRSKAHLAQFDSRLSLRDVVRVTGEDMQNYQLAGPLPLPWSEEDRAHPCRKTMAVLREIAVSRLHGSGIEFGAGNDPVAVPLRCDVSYADFFTDEEVRGRVLYAPGTDHVPLHYRMRLDDLGVTADGSLDFVIVTHLIQQVRNPLRVFEQVHRKLRRGGSCVLIVPDMRRMFDRDRELTTLDHLVADHEHPSADRDLPHYFEFFKKVYGIADELLAGRVEQAIATNELIHFHTWTYESFGAMVKHIRRKMGSWRSVWSQPGVEEDPGSYEFYFVLEK